MLLLFHYISICKTNCITCLIEIIVTVYYHILSNANFWFAKKKICCFVKVHDNNVVIVLFKQSQLGKEEKHSR